MFQSDAAAGYLWERFRQRITGFFTGRTEARLASLRDSWGRPAERERDFGRIDSYYRLDPPGPDQFSLDERTWRDLELDAVYSVVERCQGRPGRQYLYRMLRVPAGDSDALAARFERYGIITRETDLRETVQLILQRLDHPASEGVAALLWSELPAAPRFAFLFHLASAAAMASLALAFLHPLVLLTALAACTLNSVINGTYFRRLDIHSGSLSALNGLLAAAEKLGKLPESRGLSQLDFLRGKAELAIRLRRKIGWLVRDKSNTGELLSLTIEFLNMIGLFDLLAFIRSLKHLRTHREELRELFDAVGSLDAEIAVADWLAGAGVHCKPEFTDGRGLLLKDCVHPLIGQPVPNSLELHGESLLVTGSNMAGKTTFIKTIGLNVILGRSLGVCLAAEAALPGLKVLSSIERDSGVEDRRSRYLAEIDRLNEFIRLAGQDSSYLFLVDEIFHGTNTLERVSAATAVLRFLGQRASLLVTTHDLELADFLAGAYRMCHFSEVVEGERFFFDYLLKPGPCNTRNAIRLLELEGYPPEVVEAARAIAGRMSGPRETS